MKTILTLSILLISTLAFAQEKNEAPKKEFAVSLSENTLAIKPGESKQLEISIKRSKSYSGLKAQLGTLNPLPKGVLISFDPEAGTMETSTVKISVAPETIEGTYSLVLGATINYRKKGSVLNVVITNKPAEVVNASN